MWVPSGEWFYTNQAPPANQSIAQYAERHSKTKIRPKPYDRPEGSFRIPRIQKGIPKSLPEDGDRRNLGISMEANPKRIRAEGLKEVPKNRDLPSLEPPPPLHLPSSSSVVAKQGPSLVMNKKKKSPRKEIKKNERWLAFKAKKKAAKVAEKSSASGPPLPPQVVQVPLEPQPRAPASPQQLHINIDNTEQGDPFASFSTANGSVISFGDFQPFLLGDTEELELLDN